MTRFDKSHTREGMESDLEQTPEDELIRSLWLESETLRLLMDMLRGDHVLTDEELECHLILSKSRRYSLSFTRTELEERRT